MECQANLHEPRALPEGDEEAVVRDGNGERVAYVGAAMQLEVVLALVAYRVDRVAAVDPKHAPHLVIARDSVGPPAVLHEAHTE